MRKSMCIVLLVCLSFVSFVVQDAFSKSVDEIDVSKLISSSSPSELFKTADNYFAVNEESKQHVAAEILGQVSWGDFSRQNKQKAVSLLIAKGLHSPYPSIVYQTIGFLTEIPKDLFTDKTLLSLEHLIRTSPPHYKLLVRLSGQLQLQQLVSYYKTMITGDSVVQASDVWAMRLALGRMGDTQQTSYCLSVVKNKGLNDQVIYYAVPDLIYLRSREVYDYLLDQILINDTNCTTTDPDNEMAITCAYRLMELITPYIKGFPVELYASGDIKSDDYTKTLQVVRTWITNNRYLYQINE